ncbi:hypothetical protein H0Z60_08985 [Ectothiorhodospiraceae bacterium WFHF3C12]|nr:hypothetical protein [Ectothiorhodospiraceae bacterium WFHF3C12]
MDQVEEPHWESHAKGDAECESCNEGFPHDCMCGGLVHGEIAAIPDDGFVQLTHCDRCGEPEMS